MNATRVSIRAGRGLGMALLLLSGFRPARASEVIITITGVTEGGDGDPLHYFTTQRETNGLPATIVFTFDDTKGKPFSNPCGSISGIDGSWQDSPGTAVVTINGKSVTIGGHWNSHSEAQRQVPSACSGSVMTFEVDNNVRSGLVSDGAVSVQLSPAKNTGPLTTEVDWRAALTATNLDEFYSKGNVIVPIRGGYGAQFGIAVKSVTISGPHKGPDKPAVIPLPAAPVMPVPAPPSLDQGIKASKIYVLSGDQGCRVSTFSTGGERISSVLVGGDGCNNIALGWNDEICVTWPNPLMAMTCHATDGHKLLTVKGGIEGATAAVFHWTNQLVLLERGAAGNNAMVGFYHGFEPTPLTIPTYLNNAVSIAMDPMGKTYVASQGNSVIAVYAGDGKPTGFIKHAVNLPRAIALGTDGRLYVANFVNVTAYLPDGRWTTPVIAYKSQATAGWVQPMALATDSNNHLYVGYNDGAVGIYDVNSGRQVGGFFIGKADIRGIAVR